MSLRDEILAAADAAVALEKIHIPEWGIDVWVRGMTGAERDAFETSLPDGPDRVKNMRARLASVCTFDADGKRVFSQADIEALGDKSAAALDRIFGPALEMSGLSKSAMDDAKKN